MKTFRTITLSTLLLVSATGAAVAQDRLVPGRCEHGKQISRRVQRPATEALPIRWIKIERCGGVTLISGNLNLRRFVENLRAAEGLLGLRAGEGSVDFKAITQAQLAGNSNPVH